MILARIIFVGNYRTVVTIPGGAGTSSTNFCIPHQATIAGPMPRIVSFVVLSLFFTPKCSILIYLSLLNRLSSAVFHHPLYSLTCLAGSTLYSLPPVTPSEVFKILNTSPLKSSLDYLHSFLLKSCPAVFLILSPTLPTCPSIKVIFPLSSSPLQSLLF